MNLAAVEDMEARFPDTDVVLIESGGDNLTLTFSPALVDFFIYVIDVAAGDKIPRKNGPGISQSDILVINKTDLAPYVGASLEVMDDDSPADARRQAVRLHQLQDRRGHRRAGRADPRERPVRPGVREPQPDDAGRGARAGAYQDEPTQLPQRPFGKDGRAAARLRAARRPHGPGDLDRQAPLLVQRALYWDEEMPGLPCVFIITTSGGILQGDRYAIEIDARRRRAGARHHPGGDQDPRDGRELRRPRTRASRSGRTPTSNTSRPDHPAPPVALPQRTPDHASTRTATLLYSEVLMAGRKYYGDGELFDYDVFSSHGAAHARPDGSRCSPRSSSSSRRACDVSRLGVMGDFDVFGNLIVLTPDSASAEPLFAPRSRPFRRRSRPRAGRQPAAARRRA